MQKTENKTNNSVKSKLVAAIAMLLVATIMVVSSTYAWFTLSTKPEVSGISTAVGANGALEMLLATKDANGSWFYGTGEVGSLTTQQKNTYWGNLVDLSDKKGTYYGSQLITLYPAILNVANGKIVTGQPIKTPKYGADGRVDQVVAGGMFGLYNGGKDAFLELKTEANNYGFRAIGMASGLSAREQAFRVAVSQIMVEASSAQVKARNSLSANGDILGGIAIKKAMTDDPFTSTEIAAVGSMITGIEEALAAVEAAYLQIIYATIYSSKSNLEDTAATDAYNAAKNAADAVTDGALGAKVTAAIAALNSNGGSMKTADLPQYTEKFVPAVTALTTAKTEHAKISSKTECTWDELNTALFPLVNINVITVNTYTPSHVKENVGKILQDVTAGKGINVVIPTGGGVYADIADYAGDYTVGIKIDTKALDYGFDVGDVDATMKADSNVSPSILAAAKTAIGANPPSGDGADKPITEFYGYAIDLAFRTNASTSNLLLQTKPADRIYGDNQNEATMGKGSTMTFATTDATFNQEKMLNLMSKFKVVFYDTISSEILAYAKLDTVNGVTGTATDGLTANLYIVEEVTEEVTQDGTTTTTTTEKFVTEQTKATITALSPNVAQHVTVLVYLDGTTIENKDVAAIAKDAKSMSGTFNIQFASSAELIPMEYSDLHTAAPAANNP